MTPKIPSSLKWLIDKRARLDAEIKNKISHRARAFQKAIEFVEDEMSVLDDDFS